MSKWLFLYNSYTVRILQYYRDYYNLLWIAEYIKRGYYEKHGERSEKYTFI